jgi:hypothetical protein
LPDHGRPSRRAGAPRLFATGRRFVPGTVLGLVGGRQRREDGRDPRRRGARRAKLRRDRVPRLAGRRSGRRGRPARSGGRRLRTAGWELAAPALDEDGQSIALAEKGGGALVVEWLRIDEQDALALFLCEARPADAAPLAADAGPDSTGQTAAVQAATGEAADPAAAPAAPAAERDEDEIDPIAFVLGIGVVFGAVGAGFVWNTARHRRSAGAAQAWPTTAARVLSSEVVAGTHTDSEGDETTHYVVHRSWRTIGLPVAG